MLAEKQSFFLSRICFSELQEKQSEKQKTFHRTDSLTSQAVPFLHLSVIQEVWGLHLAQATSQAVVPLVLHLDTHGTGLSRI